MCSEYTHTTTAELISNKSVILAETKPPVSTGKYTSYIFLIETVPLFSKISEESDSPITSIVGQMDYPIPKAPNLVKVAGDVKNKKRTLLPLR